MTEIKNGLPIKLGYKNGIFENAIARKYLPMDVLQSDFSDDVLPGCDHTVATSNLKLPNNLLALRKFLDCRT